MSQPKTFRAQVIDKFIAALGAPEVAHVKAGELYRWTLHRGRYRIAMFITIDSPEFPDRAHVLISDGEAHQVEPLIAVSVNTLADADLLIERIIKQWKSVGTAESKKTPAGAKRA